MSLIDAAQNNNIRLVRRLLDSGVYPNIQDNSGDTAILLASHEGYTDIVELLLNNGANPNSRDTDGNTALMFASLNGYIEIVELLLNSGANIHNQDNFGGTALIGASINGHIEIMELLLNSGADINSKDQYDMTALLWATTNRKTDAVKLLKRHINATRMQSRFRGKLTRSKAMTQGAKQMSSLMKTAYDDDSIISTNMRFNENIYGDISKYLNKMPYNPEVERRRRREEEREVEENEYLDWLQSFSQMGGYRIKRSYRYY